jgi:hypothetical protein
VPDTVFLRFPGAKLTKMAGFDPTADTLPLTILPLAITSCRQHEI